MRVPMHGEIAVFARAGEFVGAQRNVVFVGRGRTRHDAARENDVGIVGTGRLRQPQQRVLAGAARADHEDQPPGPDRAHLPRCRRDGLAHATRPPCAPDAADHGNAARDMDADQIGALADRDLAAIGEADGLGRAPW